jgi:sugar/nucleoside kinase (ribokinase family)
VVAIGQNSLDRVGVVERLPRPAGKARLRAYAELPGGQIATAALALARLGLRVVYLGSVGDDAAADAVLAPLRAAGVDLRGVRSVAGVPTQLAQILVEEASGERTVFWHRDPRLALRPADLSRETLAGARALLLDASDPETGVWAARVAREAGAAVVLDVDAPGPGVPELLASVDFPIVSREFAESLCDGGSARDALPLLAARGARLAGVTLGEFGAIARVGSHVIESPAFEIEVRDTTGAGDAFHAGFTWALLGGAGAQRALRTAHAVAALNCGAVGAQGGLPTAAEVDDFLRARRPRAWREPV